MTNKIVLLAMAVAVMAFGHHGYAEYDRNSQVSLEGTVQEFRWGNPHVIIALATESQGQYSIEWGSVFQLSRSGINANAIKEGDRLVVTGSVNRNPEKHILTLVKAVSRPADGWSWTAPGYSGAK